jgi:hypothetical protein
MRVFIERPAATLISFKNELTKDRPAGQSSRVRGRCYMRWLMAAGDDRSGIEGQGKGFETWQGGLQARLR